MSIENGPVRPPDPAESQRLLEQLINAQEIERQRIAARLHDEAMQAMVAVGLRVQLLTAQLPEQARATLDPLNEAVSTGIRHIRELIFDLRPGVLDYARLPFVLEAFVQEFTADWEVPAKLHYAVEAEPAPHVAVTVFRIVQEALTNARRHSEANDVHIRVMDRDGGILCEVSDNGIGAGDSRGGDSGMPTAGIMEMTARARAIGGWLELSGAASGPGTTVRFWVPTREGDHPQGPTP